jgi:hypothetical protein
MCDLGQVAHDLLAGALLVRPRVRGVPVLERHVVAVVLGEGSRDLDRTVGPLVAGREHDLGAEQLEQPDPLLARVVGDHDGQPVALAPSDHRERDAGVPEVGSRIVLSDVSSPEASAASIIALAIRSLSDPVGFCPSSLAHSRPRAG